MVLPQNLPQLPDWPLVRALEPPLRLPDGIFSVRLICVAAKTAFGRTTASAAAAASGERTKESSAIVTLALYNLQVSMRCDITNKRPQTKKKKKYCHLGVLLSSAKTCTCEDQEPTRGWQVFKGRLLIYSRWVPVKTVWTNKRHLYEYIVWAAISELW